MDDLPQDAPPRVQRIYISHYLGSQEEFTDGWQRFQRRCAVARSIGISAEDHVGGTSVPAGWRLDQETYYWLPPNVALF